MHKFIPLLLDKVMIYFWSFWALFGWRMKIRTSTHFFPPFSWTFVICRLTCWKISNRALAVLTKRSLSPTTKEASCLILTMIAEPENSKGQTINRQNYSSSVVIFMTPVQVLNFNEMSLSTVMFRKCFLLWRQLGFVSVIETIFHLVIANQENITLFVLLDR